MTIAAGRCRRISCSGGEGAAWPWRGRGVAVVQSVNAYEAAEEERAFRRAVVAGLADLDAGRELSLAQAKARLGLK
jgi:hypothetical protein